MTTGKKRILAGSAGMVVLVVVVWVFLSSGLSGIIPKATAKADEITLAPKTLSFRVDATGILRATSVRNFGPPPPFGDYWQFKIVNMVPDGKEVKAGELLLDFDAQKLREELQTFQNELDQANKELEKTRVQIDLEKQELLSRLAAAENNYEKIKLKQTNDPQFDVPNKVEEDRLALEQARIEVAALKDRLDWHKKSSEATYQIIVSKKTRAENKVNENKAGMEKFQVKSDRDGVVVYKTKWNGERFQVGEGVWTGFAVLEIPELNTLIAEAFVPEVDVGKIKIGQRVEITIDAFLGKSYAGAVKSIGTLVRPKAWDIPNKVLEVQITLDQLDTSVMRPGMSVKARIDTGSIQNCLAVPLRSIRTTAEGSMVKIKRKESWREQQVKLGDSNSEEVQILEGVKSGDRIASDFAKAK
ncbi:MAG: HlyD family efflux transporter periplasmic adaptor subunit [Acidobacteria bacterium]|nr:HlyD family efflux transporter periplasmic adaptor subunit [Acidobacteriota bacterium]